MFDNNNIEDGREIRVKCCKVFDYSGQTQKYCLILDNISMMHIEILKVKATKYRNRMHKLQTS